MKLANTGALIEHVHNNLVLSQKSRFQLLLLLAVCANGCDERARFNKSLLQKRLSGSRAGDDDIALACRALQIFDSNYFNSQFTREFVTESFRLITVLVVGKDFLE